MEAAIAAVVVALIGGPVMWKLNRLDRKNSAEHAENQNALTQIIADVSQVHGIASRVDARLDEHISWHAHVQPTTQVVVNQPSKEVAA
jgi:hypothetical protein